MMRPNGLLLATWVVFLTLQPAVFPILQPAGLLSEALKVSPIEKPVFAYENLRNRTCASISYPLKWLKKSFSCLKKKKKFCLKYGNFSSRLKRFFSLYYPLKRDNTIFNEGDDEDGVDKLLKRAEGGFQAAKKGHLSAKDSSSKSLHTHISSNELGKLENLIDLKGKVTKSAGIDKELQSNGSIFHPGSSKEAVFPPQNNSSTSINGSHTPSLCSERQKGGKSPPPPEKKFSAAHTKQEVAAFQEQSTFSLAPQPENGKPPHTLQDPRNSSNLREEEALHPLQSPLDERKPPPNPSSLINSDGAEEASLKPISEPSSNHGNEEGGFSLKSPRTHRTLDGDFSTHSSSIHRDKALTRGSDAEAVMWVLSQLSALAERVLLIKEALQEERNLQVLKKKKAENMPFEWEFARSTEDSPKSCLIYAEAEPNTLVVSPKGEERWVTFKALNKLKRIDPSKISSLWFDRFTVEFLPLYELASLQTLLLTAILNHPSVLKTGILSSAVFSVFTLRREIWKIIKAFLQSKMLWENYYLWSRLMIFSSLPLKLTIWRIIIFKAIDLFQLVDSFLSDLLVDLESSSLEKDLMLKMIKAERGKEKSKL